MPTLKAEKGNPLSGPVHRAVEEAMEITAQAKRQKPVVGVCPLTRKPSWARQTLYMEESL